MQKFSFKCYCYYYCCFYFYYYSVWGFFISIVWGFFLLVLLVWTQKHSENLTCFQDSRLPSIYQLTLRWCRAWSTVEPECINKVFAPWVFRYIIMAWNNLEGLKNPEHLFSSGLSCHTQYGTTFFHERLSYM